MFGSLIAALVTGETVEAFGRAKRAIVAYAIAGLLLAIGVGFLIGAGYIRLSRSIGPLYAALAIGGGFIVVAVIILLWHQSSSRTRAVRFRRSHNAEMKKVAIATGITVLPLLLRSRAGLSLLAMPFLGILAQALYRENGRRRPVHDYRRPRYRDY